MPCSDHVSRNTVALPVMSAMLPMLPWGQIRARRSRARERFTGAAVTVGCYGPIIGLTLNLVLSRPNWYMTSATRWILTLSIAVG